MKMSANALNAWQIEREPSGQPQFTSTSPQRSVDAGTELAQRIEQAHKAFVERTRKKIARATELTMALKEEQAPAMEAALEELRTLAHSLAGTAGSFGYAGLSDIAETLETAISSGQHHSQSIPSLVIEMAYEFLDGTIGKQANLAR